ncbi:phosphodiester glycosidase family protein [Paenibacillus sp.]|uniref:phosphodiester glycosidase family protein n=1 Tax=Paenibacillus sp. TaxID=58172 RepID=UPI0028B07CF6|nr:phosphodiester glycosidase family protein [Paenibacillus sp.]
MPTTLPYTLEFRESVGGQTKFAIIKVPLSRVKPEIINTQMQQTPHIGINGGFFAAANGYNQPATGLRAISYWKGDSNYYSYNGTSSSQVSRKTFVSYLDSSNNTRATYIYAKNLNEVLANYPTAQAVIGGMDYNRSSWTSDIISTGYDFAAWRTVLAWDGTYGYLMVTNGTSVTVSNLKLALEEVGLNPANSIVLDGSGSTAMRVVQNDAIHWYGSPTHERYIGNMVRVYGIDWF